MAWATIIHPDHHGLLGVSINIEAAVESPTQPRWAMRRPQVIFSAFSSNATAASGDDSSSSSVGSHLHGQGGLQGRSHCRWIRVMPPWWPTPSCRPGGRQRPPALRCPATRGSQRVKNRDQADLATGFRGWNRDQADLGSDFRGWNRDQADLGSGFRGWNHAEADLGSGFRGWNHDQADLAVQKANSIAPLSTNLSWLVFSRRYHRCVSTPCSSAG
jgi:hypothetical protein